MKKTTLLTLALIWISAPSSAFTINDALKAAEIASELMQPTTQQTQGQTAATAAKPPFDKFYSAKRELTKHLHKNPYTFYTNCKINITGKGKISPDLRSCNYVSRGNKTRARRIEFEHIFPVSWAKKQFSCWSDGGRDNCQKTSKTFNAMEADPVNLVPAIGEVNGDRSNYRFAELTSGFDYGSNGLIYFDQSSKRFSPPEDKKGWIGRVHLYMVEKYNIKLSSSYMKLMSAWAKKPATPQECEYNKLTSSWGYENKHSSIMCNNH